ncbi:hypothetical protein FOL47_008294 [Perkinsus chesapeaki]|uniref:PHD-type domain-containing protein n=1 Tax=Perkinsus chesapeaki TaxID=330153 RepID=A0A7J6LFX1_PERCH|nr:hypothetical protein FOL47_008294 [Perkinsus chesapeaki]
MLCGSSFSQSQGPPASQPPTQSQSDIYYIPQNWHPAGLHSVYPGGAHWGSSIPPQGHPYGHPPYRQQTPQTQEENDTEMDKLKAALNGGQLGSCAMPNMRKSNNEPVAPTTTIVENTAIQPKKKAGGVVKFDENHMFCSPEPIELLGGKVTCYSITNTLDGCQYFRCARCMKLQLFKSVDTILRHQSSQACKAQAKTKDNMLENKPEVELDDKPSTTAGSPDEPSTSTKADEGPANLSPLARPTFRKATLLSPPPSAATDAPVDAERCGEVSAHRHGLGTKGLAAIESVVPSRLHYQEKRDDEESKAEKATTMLKLVHGLVDDASANHDKPFRFGSTTVSLHQPESPLGLPTERAQLPADLPEVRSGINVTSEQPTESTRSSESTSSGTSCLALNPANSSKPRKTDKPPSVPLCDARVDAKSSSPLRRFVEVRARQIHERFGSAFAENEITDVLLLEWLRRQAAPIPITEPPVGGTTPVESTLEKPRVVESPACVEAAQQYRTNKRELRTASKEVPKTIPKKKTKSRKRQRVAKSEGSTERSVNEIALAWNKTFEQVAEDSTSAPKRRSRRGLLCETCNIKSSKETVKCSNCQKHWHKACHDPKLDEDIDFSTIEWVCWPCQKKWLAIRKVCHAVGDDIWSSSIRKSMWWPCRVVGLQCRHPYDPSIYCIQPYGQSDREKTSIYSACEKSIRKWHSIDVESSDIASALSNTGRHLSGKNLKEVTAALNMVRQRTNGGKR